MGFYSVFIAIIIAIAGSQQSRATSIDLKIIDDLSLACDSSEDFDEFLTYSSCKIMKGRQRVYAFDLNTEFEVKDGYPEGYLKSGKRIINLYLNDRPFRDKIVSIHIRKGRVAKIDTLPLFPMEPFSIDSSEKRYVAWLLDLYEKPDDQSIPYVPVLYYSVDSGEFVFDEKRTKEVNTKIYGKYFGRDYQENRHFRSNPVEKRLNAVLDDLDCTKTQKITCKKPSENK